MHEVPIVCSPLEAINSFVDSRLDILNAVDYITVLNN